jgi:hypothetical protein
VTIGEPVSGLILTPHVAAGRAMERRAHASADVFRGWDEAAPSLDPQWQEALNRMAPRDGTLSWLHVGWNPGYPWHPVRRWTIYQMVERTAIPSLLLPALEGPDPRTLGWWEADSGEWNPGTAGCTRMQWRLYRQTGCLAETFWIVQGERGGHKAKFNRVESAMATMQGLSPTPPIPGALPFAPFDNRVLRKLEALHDANIWGQCIAYGERNMDVLERVERNEMEQMRSHLWDWLETQVAPAAEEVAGVLARDWTTADVPTVNRSLKEDEERERQAFITAESE